MNQHEENHLPKNRIRPKFEIVVDLSVEALVNQIKHAIQDDLNVDARIIDGHTTLFIVEENRHYWSPELSLYAELVENESGTSKLRGRYGPRPSVWTMFVFFYGLIGFTILVISLFGFTNYSLGNPALILWFIPVLLIIFLSLYIVSYFGQKIGHDHMIVLHEFLEKNLSIIIE